MSILHVFDIHVRLCTHNYFFQVQNCLLDFVGLKFENCVCSVQYGSGYILGFRTHLEETFSDAIKPWWKSERFSFTLNIGLKRGKREGKRGGEYVLIKNEIKNFYSKRGGVTHVASQIGVKSKGFYELTNPLFMFYLVESTKRGGVTHVGYKGLPHPL